jgi:hypothetical protein
MRDGPHPEICRLSARSVDRWVGEIMAARDEASIVHAVRNYLGTILPSELEQLPAGCRVFEISTPAEIAEAAVTLTHCELRAGYRDGSELLRELSKVFVTASHRLTRLHHPLGRRPTA